MLERKSNYHEFNVGDEAPIGAKKIKSIIIRDVTFIVYLDDDNEIQWSTEGYGEFDPMFGDIQNKISFWETVVNCLFTKKEAYNYKCLLAEAYARILDDKDSKLANDIIDRTVERMQKQGKEILKQDYIISAFVCTVSVMIFLFVFVLLKKFILQAITYDSFQIIVISLFGGIGAFVFTTLRIKRYTPDIMLSKNTHKIDGALRIFYGLILGLVISVGIKSGVILSFVNELNQTIYLKAFLGIIAGASEVLIPSFIKQIEEKSS